MFCYIHDLWSYYFCVDSGFSYQTTNNCLLVDYINDNNGLFCLRLFFYLFFFFFFFIVIMSTQQNDKRDGCHISQVGNTIQNSDHLVTSHDQNINQHSGSSKY